MNLSEQAKRHIQAVQGQALQAVVQQIEQDQGPAVIIEQKFQERRQTRRVICTEMMKILRGRPENGPSSIPGDVNAPTSQLLAEIAMSDTQALMDQFDVAEAADERKKEFELQKQKNAPPEGPRIVTAPQGLHPGRG